LKRSSFERKTFQGAQTRFGHAAVLPGGTRQKHRDSKEATGGAGELHRHIFFHPDCDAAASDLATTRTVGLGISPNLLTSSPGGEERSRARGLRRIPPVGNSTPP
jgi:hypothetical protein